MMGRNSKKGLLGGFILYALALPVATPADAKELLVFSAASLALPLQEIANTYSQETKIRVRISFAASSTLARQISKAAPADIYISANRKWMAYLAKRVPIIARSQREILSNALVLIAPAKKTPISMSPTLTAKSLDQMLNQGRLAIGDPDHVPVGIYAREALKSLNLWTSVKGNLARLSNARAVLAFVERGATPRGIVYRSDADNNNNVAIVYSFPPSSHPPITYWAARTDRTNSPATQAFFKFLFSQQAKDVFKRHGFLVK